MKIELKNIQYHKGLSESAHAFSARVYINDTYAADAHNRGRDVVNSIDHKDAKGRQLLDDAESYCGKLDGKTPLEIEEGRSFYLSLSYFIDDLITAHLQQKEDARFQNKIIKAMTDGIVYGKADNGVSILRFEIKLAELLAHPKGPMILKDKIQKEVLPDLKDGNRILNTNIPEHILRHAGLTQDQYANTPEQGLDKPKHAKKTKRKL